MDKRCLNKIIKICGRPIDFTFEYINGASDLSDLRRARKYVKCTNKIEREYNKNESKAISKNTKRSRAMG